MKVHFSVTQVESLSPMFESKPCISSIQTHFKFRTKLTALFYRNSNQDLEVHFPFGTISQQTIPNLFFSSKLPNLLSRLVLIMINKNIPPSVISNWCQNVSLHWLVLIKQSARNTLQLIILANSQTSFFTKEATPLTIKCLAIGLSSHQPLTSLAF